MEASAIPAPPVGLARTRANGRFLRLRSDEQLVAMFRAGDESAFQAIHDRYRQRLFAYARQMLGGSRQDAEDAMQDVFLRAYGALRADSRPVSLRAWLYRVAHNRCIDHLRRPVPAPAEVFEMSRRPLHDPIEESERREDLRRLVHDVRNLPSQQRSALLMREMDGMSYAELADALEVTVPAVKSLLVRARIGLVEAGEARDTACVEIRESLALSHGRGVRASGLARRHLRECDDCRDYRTQLKAVNARMAALNPAPVFGSLAGLGQLLGLGGAGTSAAAGGGVAVVGGGGAVVTKAAVVVCCVAVTAGGATTVRERIKPRAPAEASAATPSPNTAGASPALAVSSSGVRMVEPLALPVVTKLAALRSDDPKRERERGETGLAKVVPVAAEPTAISPHADAGAPAGLAEVGGGAIAPHEEPAAETAPAVTSTEPAVETVKAPSSDPVTAAEPAPLSETTAASPEIDGPTVEGSAGGAVAP
ncbi:MAG: sigma-70 family RNA polymerase sigma factor [Solirubrobacteraceae bacterium]|nr:sigma-70 family RNA polymerase sigma factor [Solirubrobacteraceae bacterium]